MELTAKTDNSRLENSDTSATPTQVGKEVDTHISPAVHALRNHIEKWYPNTHEKYERTLKEEVA